MEESIRALRPPSRRRRRPPPRRSSSSSLSPSPSCRFTELLLEHGERHVEDWAAVASSAPSAGIGGGGAPPGPVRRMESVDGRLRLCTKSVVFEPRHPSRGMIRVPFADMAGPPALVADGSPAEGRGTVEVRAGRHAVMRENNIVGPYRHVRGGTEFRFAFRYSSPAAMVEACGGLMRGMRGGGTGSDGAAAPVVSFEEDLEGAPPTIPLPTSDGPSLGDPPLPGSDRAEIPQFDRANFETVGESPLSPTLSCSVKTPLLEDRGISILTDRALYFQPVSAGLGAADGTPPSGARGRAAVWPHGDLVGLARRYDGLKDTGLEVYTQDGSALLAFDSARSREAVLRLILERTSGRRIPLPVYTDRSYVEQASELWHAGRIDNYEYLLVLNSAAGRSFHDLSRYPVMPWVLSDYGTGSSEGGGDDAFAEDGRRTKIDLDDESNYRDLSRPIGALNEERYKGFEARYESLMQSPGKGGEAGGNPLDAPFLYGTHYSAPGYVLYYLLRNMPQHMLCLQNGRFDVPDRLFHSVGSTYRSALENPADLKELIPEMFDADCSDFLINSGGLRLGSLQTGERVDDVLLPPWARGARHFVKTNRRALESDVCTRGLHRWIDLVFGSRSRGLRARDAGNLFHPLTYLGPADLDGLPAGERRRVEVQSAEFGITPDMLFCLDHPPRGSAPLDGGRAMMTRDALRESYAAEGPGGLSWRGGGGVGTSPSGRTAPSVPRADDVIAESMNLLESTDAIGSTNPFDD